MCTAVLVSPVFSARLHPGREEHLAVGNLVACRLTRRNIFPTAGAMAVSHE